MSKTTPYRSSAFRLLCLSLLLFFLFGFPFGHGEDVMYSSRTSKRGPTAFEGFDQDDMFEDLEVKDKAMITDFLKHEGQMLDQLKKIGLKSVMSKGSRTYLSGVDDVTVEYETQTAFGNHAVTLLVQRDPKAGQEYEFRKGCRPTSTPFEVNCEGGEIVTDEKFLVKYPLTPEVWADTVKFGNTFWKINNFVWYKPFPYVVHAYQTDDGVTSAALSFQDDNQTPRGYILEEWLPHTLSLEALMQSTWTSKHWDVAQTIAIRAKIWVLVLTVLLRQLDEGILHGDFTESNVHFVFNDQKEFDNLDIRGVTVIDLDTAIDVNKLDQEVPLSEALGGEKTNTAKQVRTADTFNILHLVKNFINEADFDERNKAVAILHNFFFDYVKTFEEHRVPDNRVYNGDDENTIGKYICDNNPSMCPIRDQIAIANTACQAIYSVFVAPINGVYPYHMIPACGHFKKEGGLLTQFNAKYPSVKAFHAGKGHTREQRGLSPKKSATTSATKKQTTKKGNRRKSSRKKNDKSRQKSVNKPKSGGKSGEESDKVAALKRKVSKGRQTGKDRKKALANQLHPSTSPTAKSGPGFFRKLSKLSNAVQDRLGSTHTKQPPRIKPDSMRKMKKMY